MTLMRGTPRTAGRQATQRKNMRRCARMKSGTEGIARRKKMMDGSKKSRVKECRDARGAVTTKALPEAGAAVASAAAVEVAQLAVYENEIWQTAGIVFGCVLLVRRIHSLAPSLFPLFGMSSFMCEADTLLHLEIKSMC